VVLIGEETLTIAAGEAFLAAGHKLIGISTSDDAVRQWAETRQLSLLPPVRDHAAWLPLPAFDLILSAANLSIVPAAMLAQARLGGVNFHDGPLPRYGGLNAPMWAMLAGETSHGIRWHRMFDELDAGEILAERTVPVIDDDSVFALNARCYAAALDALPDLLVALERAPRATGIAPEAATYRGRADRPDACVALDLAQPTAGLLRTVRALDFGPYANPVGSAKLAHHDRLLLVGRARVADGQGRPGEILACDGHALVIATVDGAIAFDDLRCHSGVAIDGVGALQQLGASIGTVLDGAAELRPLLTDVLRIAARGEAAWTRDLAAATPGTLPLTDVSGARALVPAIGAILPAVPLAVAGAALATLLARRSGLASVTLGLRDDTPAPAAWWRAVRPLTVAVDLQASLSTLAATLAAQCERVMRRGPVARDLAVRQPRVRAVAERWFEVQLCAGAAPDATDPAAIALVMQSHGVALLHDPARIAAAEASALLAQLHMLLEAAIAAPETPAGRLPRVPHDHLQRLQAWNSTATPLGDDAVLHSAFERHATTAPARIAVSGSGQQLTYGALNARATQIAQALRAHGVVPGTIVGVMLDRSPDLVATVLGVLKAGAAYLPLDPAYPADRLAFMQRDSGARVIVTTRRHRWICVDGPALLVLDSAAMPAVASAAPCPATGADLAYVIYTSGSTGTPKGVMVEHRNVLNFFAAMDQRLGTEPGTWLAVTSLSFDISVLELLWTLARGFTIELASAEPRAGVQTAARPLDFSLFYFSADATDARAGGYQLLLEGAKFADTHDFTGVWIPERHFHAFGGLYPNPAVAAAAVAAVTSKVEIRAGSVVLPLHHPARIAEEWAMVDNLSGGRVAISFASGWQPDDFILAPERFKDRKQHLADGIEIVRRLWRGEKVPFRGPLGTDVPTSTLPRPVRAELPVWLTAAGNPETFAAAGRAGARLLTHLLGQTTDELQEKIRRYRDAWTAAGYPGNGHVTLMLHAFVGTDSAMVKETVRRPMTEYLRSSVDLIKQYAWSFPAFAKRGASDAQPDLSVLAPEEMDALLAHSFERYYATSGLFGTPSECRGMLERASSVGVDEIACLIDFGVAADAVLAHLPYLDAVRADWAARATAQGASVPDLLAHGGITHLQCTPSLARVLAADPSAQAGLRRLQRWCVGGEALDLPLARQLDELASGRVMNMYGPTETTVWSTTADVRPADGPVPLGTPIANTVLRVLDMHGEPVPLGEEGELCIGGHGVTRGYLHRAELTAERFIVDRWSDDAGARLYRTGDRVVWQRDGRLTFLGRVDTQVKLRGYRIELGEIETRLLEQPGVREAAVLAREDVPGDVRLVAYLVGLTDVDALRTALSGSLPDYMIPSAFVTLTAFPQTPNGKTDRNAFPRPDAAVRAPRAFAPPSSPSAQVIAELWRMLLSVDAIGADDNFFDLGGHSLLAIEVHRRLKAELAPTLSLTDLFRFPTVRLLAAHIEGVGQSAAVVTEAAAGRAEQRRAAMQRRVATHGRAN